MRVISNPDWINHLKFDYENYEQIPSHVFDEINANLDKVQSKRPLVSILISAWNEEVNILRCVASLSRMKTKIPFEIIVINNNSKDRTQDTVDRLHVRSMFEEKQGCGPARQTGQKNAAGEYILLADADCFYPACWVDEMMKVLVKQDVVCVYGRYSFISEPGFPRWKLYILESMKDVISEIRQLNRPYYNAYGLSMGYVKEFGLKVGFIETNFWGDDGQLCLGLMKYGKIKQVRSNKARAWTSPRTLQRTGNFSQALNARIVKELKRFKNHFNTRMPKNISMTNK
ncbi:glycosyltransferase family 2 protein [Rufibacter hautae]|uniref:Glycosyltransferase family 2 protein n=1 Tax=Rufibacter hautae TaxID=2595005 RepID=A0A5B6TL03_9BACT|nr:glycosyltransferase family 2 protein [Rufibacter hautae]KAA3436772.1 glycosyltransferase family 2 protein [Rufibacter hautae]